MKELEKGVIYKLPIKNGYLDIRVSIDSNYPGLDVEYIDESEEWKDKPMASRPRVLIECPEDTKELRALIWNNLDKEDYQEGVTLVDKRYDKRKNYEQLLWLRSQFV